MILYIHTVTLDYNFIFFMHLLHCIPVTCLHVPHLHAVRNEHVMWKYKRRNTPMQNNTCEKNLYNAKL